MPADQRRHRDNRIVVGSAAVQLINPERQYPITIELGSHYWQGTIAVDAPRLAGWLRSADGDIPLHGSFTARRDTGVAISRMDQTLPAQLRDIAPVKQFRDGVSGAAARMINHWTTIGHVNLEFQDTIIEFDLEGRSAKEATCQRPGEPAGSPSIHCAELLDRIDHFTLDSEYVLDELEIQVRRLRLTRGSPAEIIRRLWFQGLLRLNLGQVNKGLEAVRASFQVAPDDATPIAASEKTDALCRDLAGQLTAIGERDKAEHVAKMLSRPS